MKFFSFIGDRIFKTGVAVFLTALVCQWIGWPPVFAVITAIVTVEPTVSDSIKKGLVRFPASAIGSAYAVLFISLFGNSPITYTLATVCTIVTCFRLKLHAGLLVATLTAVAMVEVIHSNFLVSFFIRLGTTTIGLAVSTLVNMFILPPKYRLHIFKRVKTIRIDTANLIEQTFQAILEGKRDNNALIKENLNKTDHALLQTEQLSRFQRDEAKFHPLLETEQEQFEQLQHQLNSLRIIHYHLNNLIRSSITNLSWTELERKTIMNAVYGATKRLQGDEFFIISIHHRQLKEITDLFWEDSEETIRSNLSSLTNFPPELIILYELVSIYQMVERFYSYEHTGAKAEAHG
ncbi:aromatic acid exporter family protein [Oceanobacillus sp. FSL K6-2867]|uniref:aromatic acid exporter family protein n=1 Tax=Oceanobacillus sp. FSL K6-2867 TaxID=2954748 RepID=UPI0030DC2A33